MAPARYAAAAEATAKTRAGGGTSFDSGLSSALGVFGDLGVIGFAAYAALLGWLLHTLTQQRSREATSAASGLAMFALLGLVFDWWEQPPMGIVVGVLIGLALCSMRTASAQSTDART
jgi:hypothetical protein